MLPSIQAIRLYVATNVTVIVTFGSLSMAMIYVLSVNSLLKILSYRGSLFSRELLRHCGQLRSCRLLSLPLDKILDFVQVVCMIGITLFQEVKLPVSPFVVLDPEGT